ncbi:hypothetical protein HHI36_010370 [Cryptolaemus montrouzieri]|uniref:Uncharacterized protein n=1 Tax=Cryptolaemus montrouzieri TaxID=559131 RepID=A0ABD2MJ00_9CUCU
MYMSKLCTTLMLYLNILSNWPYVDASRSRQKRLVWPPGGDKIQVIAGAGIPVSGLSGQTVIVGIVYKANYALPSNVTQLQSQVIRQRRKIDDHNYIRKLLTKQNEYTKSCVLRALCEAAIMPFDDNGGLIDEILHAISKSAEKTLKDYDSPKYQKIINQGIENYHDCSYWFPECRMSFLDIISRRT